MSSKARIQTTVEPGLSRAMRGDGTQDTLELAELHTIHLFGFPIRNITLDHAVTLIHACLRGQQASTVCFVNAHCINVAQADQDYRRLLHAATHLFADGVGMRIASLLSGRPLVENVNGTDLVPRLCKSLEGTGTRVFLLGAEKEVVQRFSEHLREQHPGLSVCGVHHGYFGDEQNDGVVEEIRAAGTDLLLVAMGVPRQEKWVARSLAATNAKVAISVGGLFDYGIKTRRAPSWMRRMGLEWLGRLIPGWGEPRRLWKRYLLGNFRFLWLATMNALLERRRSRHGV